MSTTLLHLDILHAHPAEWHALERIGWRSLATTDALPTGPLWREMERLDDRHPRRFERWHPDMARLLEAARRLEHHAGSTHGLSSSVGAVGSEGPHGVDSVSVVAEPVGFLLLLVGIVGVMVSKWVLRRGWR